MNFVVRTLVASGVLLAAAAAQNPAAAPETPAAAPAVCTISGRVRSGNFGLPGVAITAANTLTGKKVATSTDPDGSYSITIPPKGRYVVRAELAAFATYTSEVVINAANCSPHVDVNLTLQSRATPAPDSDERQQQVAGLLAGRGFQNLGPGAGDLSSLSGQSQTDTSTSLAAGTGGLAPTAFTQEGATESVAVSGNQAQSNESMFGTNDDMRERIQDMRDRAARGDLPPGAVLIGGGAPGGFGGPGGGFGGPGGGGGFGGGGQTIRIGGRGRFNFNQPHGSFYYNLGDSAFDATPYSVTGQPSGKAQYVQQRFGATVGGPLNIPHIYKGGTKTFFFINYTGNLTENPYDVFSNVPTMAERTGDFSATRYLSGPDKGQLVQLYDPVSHQPIAGNRIAVSNSAQQLLSYVPEPNQPDGVFPNFHYVSSTNNNSHNVSLRLIHNFGDSGGFPGPGGGGGRRGGNRNNINFGLQYHQANNVLTNPFPTLGGSSSSSGWNVPFGWSRSKGHFSNNLRFNYNRNYADTTNLYAGITDIAALAGITNASNNSFDWGVPGLNFSNFSSLHDINPQQRTDQTFSIGDNMIWTHKKHTFRWGGDYRRVLNDLRNDQNSRGNFYFTGLYTSAIGPTGPIAGTGYDFADFLLGLSQQAAIQYGSGQYNFRSNVYNLFLQDDWRVRGNLTLNLGVRYEYYSPLTEAHGRLANLAIAPGFTSAVPVCATSTAGCSTQPGLPESLVNPDRNNFAPRVGIAWKPFRNTVVRAGYGINYNTGAYTNIALQFAYQPPFAFTQTNTYSAAQLLANAPALTFQNAFANLSPAGTTNNFAADPNYHLGYVQIWNLDIQRELTKTLLLNVGYTGTKGTALDIVRAPNRNPDGTLRIAGVQPFLYQASQGFSTLHSGSVRLRKRMTHGVSVGGTYVFSKSIDNASSIGGGAVVVAQNDQDLAAERGLSSFDQRHRLTTDFFYELPFGSNKKWLSGKALPDRIFGDWQVNGSFTVASGLPFTPRVLGSFAEVSQGVNGTLRADYTGAPIHLSNPTLGEWFNPAAFTAPPAGQFGDAGRNSIVGPGSWLLNMSLAKEIAIGDTKGLELRWQVNNVLNHPNYTGIDTVVNSLTYGQVIAVGSMRTMQVSTRFHF